MNIDQKTLTKKVKNLRDSISATDQKKINLSLHDLYNDLILPVSDITNCYSEIGIIPHSCLHYLPFQALIDTNNKFMIQNHVLFSATSLSVYYINKRQKRFRENTFLGIAYGELQNSNYRSLSKSINEIKNIAEFYPKKLELIQDSACENIIKKEAPLFSILHFSTHAVLNKKEPFKSFLLLNKDTAKIDDGELHVDEILNIKLNAKLILLSACETALGAMDEGDELIGLYRSLMYAGTPTIVASLWTVDESISAVQMTILHQYLYEGYSIAEAYTYSQRDILDPGWKINSDKALPDFVLTPELQKVLNIFSDLKKRPYYWSSFILMGDNTTSL